MVTATIQSRTALKPTGFEKVLAYGATVLLIAILTAIGRGYGAWSKVPLLVWLHLATIVVSLLLTPMLLLGRRGIRRHRQLGYAWVASMTLTAALSFGIRTIHPGGFSPIHALSAFTLVQVPLIAFRAHRHQVDAHRRAVLLMVTGALLIAGFFTFPFGRLLGRWLLGSG